MSVTKQAHPLVRFAVERRVTMAMFVVGLLVLGVLALTRLPLEFLPAISSSSISVSADYSGSSPEEITREIVQPLEESLGTLNGLDRMASTASASNGRVNLEFVAGTDMNLAAVEVRDRIDRVRDRMPSDLRQIRVRRFQSTDIPVLRLSLTADWQDSDRLYTFAEDILQPRLERLTGVAQIDLRGVRRREVQVRLDAGRLAAHGVGPRQVASVLSENNLTLSAGDVTEGSRKLRVRVVGELARVDQIRALSVGPDIRLGDVAEVTYTFPEQTDFDYLNGTEALGVRVYKASNANLLEVVDRVKAEVAVIEAEPRYAGVRARIFRDSSLDVRRGLSQLRDAGLIGGALAVLAVFLFLRRLRTTLLVAIAIPVSVVATFVLMYLIRQSGWADLTLNVVSLMGLVLALGMLVDSAIVVIESIYRRVQDHGEVGKVAAIKGASQVALPIVASTATTLCVFVPVIFDSGSSGFYGLYFREVGTVVCIVMVASLLVALTVVPSIAALLLKREAPPEGGFLKWLTGGYVALLRLTLRFRLGFVIVAGLMLWGSWHLLSGIERTFGSRSEQRQVEVAVDVPRGFGLERTAELMDDLYALVDARREELDIADISYEFNKGSGRSRRGGSRKRLEIHLKDEDESTKSVADVRAAVRALFPVIPGVELKIQQARRHWGGGGVQIEVAGDDPAVLTLIANDVAERVGAVQGVEDVDLSLESGDDEIRVQVDRDRAVGSGISSQAVAQTVANTLSNRPLDQLRTESGEVDLVMQYREEDRTSLDRLRTVRVTGSEGGQSLDAIAQFEQTPGPQSIERENRRPKLTISANASSPMASMMAMRGAGAVMAGVGMPPGYTWSFGRWNRLQQQDQDTFSFALLMSAILVYMLMAALFESYVHPLAIMASVPFAFLGVGVALRLANQPRDSLTDLGFIILVGVVVNNAIILVDHINQLRREGMSRDEAILTGGRHRLRAILMTAMTTILGLLPMTAPLFLPELFGSAQGRAGNWAPVGLVILGGLTTSTFLTLVILPTVYSMIDDIATFARRVVRA